MTYKIPDKTLTVSEVNKIIEKNVEILPIFSVVGEISDFRTSNGNWYFELIDKDAKLSVVVFRRAQFGVSGLKNGDKIVVIGKVDYYSKSGNISLIADKLDKKGFGEIAMLIEKRRLYYQSLGYFDQERKRPLPKQIRKIGVVTSKSGAAIKDILKITLRRAPSIDIILFPTLVQGDGAAENIAMRIRQANNFLACDVLIVTRGGGSEQDLLPFSEDVVIQEIYRSEIPVISAVGHEINSPISDSVADLVASTPSAAAELVTEEAYRALERNEKLISEAYAAIHSKSRLLKAHLKGVSDISHIMLNRVQIEKERIKRQEGLNEFLMRRCDLLERDNFYLIDRIESNIKSRVKMLMSSFIDINPLLDTIRSKANSYGRIIADSENLSKTLRGRSYTYSLKLTSLNRELKINIDNKLSIGKSRVSRSFAILRKGFESTKQTLNETINTYISSNKETLRRKYSSLYMRKESASLKAEALSPLNVLSRGYALLYDENGNLIKSTKDAKKDMITTTRVIDGKIISTIKGVENE